MSYSEVVLVDEDVVEEEEAAGEVVVVVVVEVDSGKTHNQTTTLIQIRRISASFSLVALPQKQQRTQSETTSGHTETLLTVL